MAINTRLAVILLLILFFSATGAAIILHQPILFLLPVAIMASLALLQYPELLLYVLIASVPWSIEFNFTPSLGTDLPDEPLMLLSAFAAIILVIYKRHSLNRRWLHPLILLLMVQLAWSLVTVVNSTFPLNSIKFFLAKCWYLLAFIALPVYLFRDRINIRRTAVVLLVSMMVFMLFTMVRHAGNGFTFDKINDSLVPFFRNHVNYSALLVFMVPLLLAFMRNTAPGRVRNMLRVLLVISLAALYLSYARGAWLALATGLAGYWLLRKKLLFAAVIMTFVLSIAAVFVLRHNDHYLKYAHDFRTTIFHTDFRQHLVATYQMRDVSTAERFYRWIAGVRMVPAHWETGIGPTTFFRNYKSYAVPAFKTWVSSNEEQSTVHNYFLLILIEQGVAGFILLIAFFLALFWYIQRIYHRTDDRFWKTAVSTTGVILVMICTVNFLSDLIETDKVGSVFYLCVSAIIIADMATRGKAGATAASPSHSWHREGHSPAD